MKILFLKFEYVEYYIEVPEDIYNNIPCLYGTPAAFPFGDA